jgi:hypothetical protein
MPPIPSHAAGRNCPPRPLPAVSYERAPGAASCAPRSFYRPREPHTSILYRIVREYLETLLDGTLHGRGHGAFDLAPRTL